MPTECTGANGEKCPMCVAYDSQDASAAKLRVSLYRQLLARGSALEMAKKRARYWRRRSAEQARNTEICNPVETSIICRSRAEGIEEVIAEMEQMLVRKEQGGSDE